MKTNRPTKWFTAVVLFSCWLALADRGASAGDKVSAKDKTKELQHQRLEAAKKARAYLVKQLEKGYLPPGAADPMDFVFRLVEVNKLVFQARLDLCETKPERIKAFEETLKELEPIVAGFETRFKTGIANSSFPFHLAQVHLLELKIALEKAKQEPARHNPHG